MTARQPGLLDQSNVGAMPDAWQRGIEQTFLVNSAETSGSTTLGSLNLWIQDKYSTVASDVETTSDPGDPVSNPGCTPGAGA